MIYNPYDALARLNEAALRHCEARYLDPHSDYGRYADDEDECGEDDEDDA